MGEAIYYTMMVPRDRAIGIALDIDPNKKQHDLQSRGSEPCPCGVWHTQPPTADSMCDFTTTKPGVDVIYRLFYNSTNGTLFVRGSNPAEIEIVVRSFGLEFNRSELKPQSPMLGW